MLLQSLQKLMDWSKNGIALELLAARAQESRIFGQHVCCPHRSRVEAVLHPLEEVMP